MTTRRRKVTATFQRPYGLNEMDGIRPAGAGAVETDEQLVQGVSFPAYRRLPTWIRLPTKPGYPAGYPAGTATANADPEDEVRDAAVVRDAAPAETPIDGNSARRTNEMKKRSGDEKADLAAEERSEDDGMSEHAKKAADPAAWAAERGQRQRSRRWHGTGIRPGDREPS